jgi:RNA polymerase sigma-70 factor (ECF subfamily)
MGEQGVLPMSGRAVVPLADPKSLSEDELLERGRAGDPAAFREIMQRNSPRLYRLARSVLRNESEAEDVLQETYLRAFRNLADFRGTSSVSTWLTRIALNEALGRLRRARPTLDLSRAENVSSANTADVIPFPTMASESDPERTLARKQIAALLESAIDKLPDPFRVVFVLRAIEDMSIEETAQQLGVAEATVKTRLHRARRLLRKSLEAEFGLHLADAFPFAGRRCARISDAVLSRLGMDGDQSTH